MGFDSIDRQFRRREPGTAVVVPATLSQALDSLLGGGVSQEEAHCPPRLFARGDLEVPGWGPLAAEAVGSRCTCDPPPVGTDQDWLAYVPLPHQSKLETALAAAGWTPCTGAVGGDPEYPDTFSAWRRGEDNLIVALDRWFLEKFRLASRVARRLNLRAKEERVALFQAILYDRCDDEHEPRPSRRRRGSGG